MPTRERLAAMTPYELDRHRRADRERKRLSRPVWSMSTAHVCPVCAGPKHHQSQRCRRCYADSIVIHGRYRKGVAQGVGRFLFRSESRLAPGR